MGAQKIPMIPRNAGITIIKVHFLNPMASQNQMEATAKTRSLAEFLTRARLHRRLVRKLRRFPTIKKSANEGVVDTMGMMSQHLTIHPPFKMMGRVAVLKIKVTV